jgi:hypothetical protein
LNLHGVLANISSCMTRPKLLLSAGTVDGFIWSYFGKLDYFFIDYCEINFNFFFLMSLLGKFARNVDFNARNARILLCQLSLQSGSFFPPTSLPAILFVTGLGLLGFCKNSPVSSQSCSFFPATSLRSNSCRRPSFLNLLSSHH